MVHGLTALVAVAEAGSITEAARRMGIYKSVLSERLADLEHSLGARLLQRWLRVVAWSWRRRITLRGTGHRSRRQISMRATPSSTATANRIGASPGNNAANGIVIRLRNFLRVNNGLIMRDAVLAGLGITLLATFLIHQELASGALQVIDIGLEAEKA
jgi:DNA-binding transcriptional LysR family regulator